MADIYMHIANCLQAVDITFINLVIGINKFQ